MIRWGICCIFRDAPIKFRRTTAKYTAKLSTDERRRHLSDICRHNANSLLEALQFCRGNGILAFRINSQILPLKTHPQYVRRRLTLENDDGLYTPCDLLPVCERLGIPFVYDLHHHRCLADGRNVEDTTRRALKTWNREPLFHISSPLCSWQDRTPRNHHDYIHPEDFPESWLNLDITVEVEAKAKELAVIKLMRDIEKKVKRHDIGSSITVDIETLRLK